MNDKIKCSVCGTICDVKRLQGKNEGCASARCSECGNTMMLSKKTVQRFDAMEAQPPAPEPQPEPLPQPVPEPKKNDGHWTDDLI